MKNLKTFDQIFESNYQNHPMADHVITKDDAVKLFGIEEDGLGPEDSFTEEEFKDYTGMTLKAYSEKRWPDEPQHQFDMAVAVLKQQD